MESRYYKSEYNSTSPYPGEYTPMPRAKNLLTHLNKHKGDLYKKPLVNIEEFDDCYKMDMNVPGATREDIFIKVYKNILTVFILQMPGKGRDKKDQHRPFDKRSIVRHIPLPANADTSFASAEYGRGILCIHISKSKGYVTSYSKNIAVY